MMSMSVSEIRRGLAAGKFSSVEITQDYLARIARFNPTLNCFISVTDEIALAQARTADAALAKGNAGALAGVPLAHKDLFCTEGVKTSCASRILDNFIAPYDATVIANFKRAGAVMLGKTNMDEFAMGSSNENSYYGSVANPWNTEHVPGGSSGGSAAAVAAGLAPGATGTDTGGSIRQPAALCGVTGIKPTYGRVSRYGMIAYGSSLDQGGPFARSAEDCALLLQTMSGFDARDSTSSEQPVPDFSAALGQGVEGL
ncbi:MAG: amidase family protein, partial [Gammaproteobacteria bacterium]|nr:amidase family protein [Gammaproteobacteria bacterium]